MSAIRIGNDVDSYLIIKQSNLIHGKDYVVDLIIGKSDDKTRILNANYNMVDRSFSNMNSTLEGGTYNILVIQRKVNILNLFCKKKLRSRLLFLNK